MKLDAETLGRVGTALYGERWQTPLADDLGVADRTMRRWVAGDAMPEPVWAEIGALCSKRGEQLLVWAKRLA